MATRLKALYRGKVFVPIQACDLPEGAEVELTITGPTVVSPLPVTDDERRRILARVVERMKNNPIPAGAPARFTRDELHERT